MKYSSEENMSNQSSFPSTPKLSNSWKSSLMTLLTIAIGTLILMLIHTLYSNNSDSGCKGLNGARFRLDHPTAPYGGGDGLFYPSIDFRNGKFGWTQSDYIIEGNYECKLGNITFDSPSLITRDRFGVQMTVQFDSTRGILLLAGDIYKKTSEPAIYSFLGDENPTHKKLIRSITTLLLGIGLLIIIFIIVRGRL
jgi:hypothetical protein